MRQDVIDNRINEILNKIIDNPSEKIAQVVGEHFTNIFNVDTTAEIKDGNIFVYPLNHKVKFTIDIDGIFSNVLSYEVKDNQEKIIDVIDEDEPLTKLITDLLIDDIKDTFKDCQIEFFSELNIDPSLTETELNIIIDKVFPCIGGGLTDFDTFVGDKHISIGYGYNEYLDNIKNALE